MQLKTIQQIVEEKVPSGSEHGWWLDDYTDELLTQDRADIRAVLKDWITKNEKELSDPYPFDSKYSYCDFVSASDLEEFLDTLLPGDVSK